MLLMNLCLALCTTAEPGLVPVAAAGMVASQDSKDAKAEFEKKYAEVGGADCKDANALFQLAVWAENNNLKTDSKRLLRQVIKIDSEHAEARAMLGYEKFEGKWLTKREIEREKAKKEEADKAALGLKKWKGEWVPAADYERLEKGLVKVDVKGETKWVTPIEKERIEKGMVLHDGQWVTPEALEHLKKGEFQVGDKWLTEAEADKVHADFSSPWELEGELVAISTTCKYQFAKQAIKHGDDAITLAYQILGLEIPKDFQKIQLLMVRDESDYRSLGQEAQDLDASLSSNWSTFIKSDQQSGRSIGISVYNVIQEGNDQGNDMYSLGHVRFGAVYAALRNMTLAEPLPQWFQIGVASYCERFWRPGKTKRGIEPLGDTDRGLASFISWSLDKLNKEGGLLDLQNMFDSFDAREQAILQAGLIVAYLKSGQATPKIQEQWKKCKEALQAPKQKGLEKDFVKLELLLSKDGEKELDSFMTTIRG